MGETGKQRAGNDVFHVFFSWMSLARAYVLVLEISCTMRSITQEQPQELAVFWVVFGGFVMRVTVQFTCNTGKIIDKCCMCEYPPQSMNK